LALWVSPHWRVTFWLQPQKVTKKGRPILFALRVPEFGSIAYAPVLMRHPGAQDYNAELANIALPMPPNSANEEGKSVKRKKRNNKT